MKYSKTLHAMESNVLTNHHSILRDDVIIVSGGWFVVFDPQVDRISGSEGGARGNEVSHSEGVEAGSSTVTVGKHQ